MLSRWSLVDLTTRCRIAKCSRMTDPGPRLPHPKVPLQRRMRDHVVLEVDHRKMRVQALLRSDRPSYSAAVRWFGCLSVMQFFSAWMLLRREKL